jgi:hypothetical protein
MKMKRTGGGKRASGDYYRLTITIPKTLRKRLGKVLMNKNWSEICTEALSKSADESESIKKKGKQ